MNGEAWTFLGVVVTTLGAFSIAMRSSKPTDKPGEKSASAAEVTALGARLDIAVSRIERLERLERGLRAYIAEDHEEHRDNSWPIRPLPQELA